MTEFVQGPGETIYLPGTLAHAVMNIEDTVSVTENYFLVDSLDDWVHGMMVGDKLIENKSDGLEEKIFWKEMYYRALGKDDRAEIRAMIEQVEYMANNNQNICKYRRYDDVE